jgi:PAS domain S-box-containing protein
MRLFFFLPKIGNSPSGLVIKVGLVVLGGELVIMVLIRGFLEPFFGRNIPPIFWDFFDAFVLTAIVAPALQMWILRPMREHEKDLRIAAVAFQTENGMLVTDADGVILRVNPAFSRKSGYTSEELIGRTPAILNSGRQDALFYKSMWKMIEEKGYWFGEIWNRRKNGQVYAELLTITAIFTPEGTVSNYLGDFAEISEITDIYESGR